MDIVSVIQFLSSPSFIIRTVFRELAASRIIYVTGNKVLSNYFVQNKFMKILRKSIGVDISKDDFKVCVGILDDTLTTNVTLEAAYANDKRGIAQFLRELKAKVSNHMKPVVVLEATGVYHELLAYTLHDKGFQVAILLPNKAKAFCKSINVRAKSDKVDAKALSQMGLERNLMAWNPPSKHYHVLKTLTRERESLVLQRTRLKNQTHAHQTAFVKNSSTDRRIKRHIKFLDEQIKEIETELRKLVRESDELNKKIVKSSKGKGVSFVTAITIVVETSGFNMISNIKQLVGYVGLDVRIDQSGSKAKKGKISKKGNSHIRKALFMPAMNAVRSNTTLKNFYEKLNERQSCKKQGIVAVQRKLLILIYSLWKGDTEYRPNMAA